MKPIPANKTIGYGLPFVRYKGMTLNNGVQKPRSSNPPNGKAELNNKKIPKVM